MEVTMTKISSSNRYDKGVQLHQFTFVRGSGAKRTSETRHMTDAAAEQHKKNLS